jgi:uncharacterized membrane protein YccC
MSNHLLKAAADVGTSAVMLSFFALQLSNFGRAFWSEMRSLPVPGPRMIDEGECVLSVLLAIAFSHALGAENVGWAAFSGYMVMRSHVAESFTRGVLRITGTVIGAGAALLLAPVLLPYPLPMSLALLAGGGITLYFAIVGHRAYAWLFTGLTFMMVLIEGMERAQEPISRFASTRILEVVAGTAACLLVSAVSTWTIRRKLPNPDRAQIAAADRPATRWYPAVARHAFIGAVALALIPWVWQWLGIESLSQSSITVFAVMLVPAASLEEGTLNPISSRLMHRLIGCVAGGLLAGAVLLLSHHSPLLMTLGLCAGVVIGRHVQNGPPSISYVGLQFTLTFLVVLVPDNYVNAAIDPGIDRLFGILFGMVLLEPVVLLAHLLWDRHRDDGPAQPAGGLAEE